MKGHINTESKKRAVHRLKIIEGKVKGLIRDIEKENYCMDVLNQSRSIQESLKGFDMVMLENHLKTHVVAGMKGKNPDASVAELLKLYKHCKK